MSLDATALGLPDEGEWVGRDQVGHGWRRWLSHWDDYRLTGSNLEQHDDHILVDLHVDATGRGSGVPVRIDHVQVWTWRDERLTRIRIFPDRTWAVDAISQSAQAGAAGPQIPPTR